MTLEDLQRHILEECPCSKNLECELCESEEKFNLNSLVAHIEKDCENAPMLCRKCELVVDRKNTQSHDCFKSLKLIVQDAKNNGYQMDKRVYQEEGF